MKTTWQKIYSTFGFWTYTECVGRDKAYKVIYWCCLPKPLRFFRKFDVYRIDISDTHSVNAQMKELIKKYPAYAFYAVTN